MWANHGDDISTQYSGTAALKGDFVRYLTLGCQISKPAVKFHLNNVNIVLIRFHVGFNLLLTGISL